MWNDKKCKANIHEVLHCISNYEHQSENVQVKLRKNQKYVSITWSKDVESNNLDIKPAVEKEQINLAFSNAYDMYYSFEEKKWMF